MTLSLHSAIWRRVFGCRFLSSQTTLSTRDDTLLFSGACTSRDYLDASCERLPIPFASPFGQRYDRMILGKYRNPRYCSHKHSQTRALVCDVRFNPKIRLIIYFIYWQPFFCVAHFFYRAEKSECE